MESPQGTVTYVFYATVLDVEHRFQRLHVAGHGPDAVFKNQPIGWFLHLQGSGESIYVGQEQPFIQPGDTVKVTIGKHHA
jgi:hypothetical protein